MWISAQWIGQPSLPTRVQIGTKWGFWGPISLGDTAFCANSVGFSLVVVIVALFVPTVCPVGGGVGYIRTIRGTASFCQHAATMSSYKFTPRAVASPHAPQKPLVRKRARSGGAEWVRVTRHAAKQAEKPHASWFTATCMRPQGTPDSLRCKGRFFCKPILGS